MVARGTVVLSNAAGKLQTLQLSLLAEETIDQVEHFEPYGFTARPRPGAEAAVVFVDGERTHGLVLAVADRRYRITALEEGDVAIYDGSSSIVLKQGGVVEISAPTAIRLISPELTHNGTPIGDSHRHGNVAPGSANTSTPI
jgi:phage baseplate assembly protein V